MATDSTSTIDQQVADRPGQTAPVPLPAGLQPDAQNQTQAMLTSATPDGSVQSGEVPIDRVKEARANGLHVAVPMKAPNGQPGLVPHHKVADALAAGFQHVGTELEASQAFRRLQELFGPGKLVDTQIGSDFIKQIKDQIKDPEARANFLVGLVQPGAPEMALEAHELIGNVKVPRTIDVKPTTFLGEQKGQTFLSDAANEFNKSEGRSPINPEHVEEDSRASQIADAYKASVHAPNDPAVKASYNALKADVDKQWDLATKKLGIKIDTSDTNPYGLNEKVPAHEELHNDVLNNKHLTVWTGGAPPADHPLSEIDPKTGLTYNTKFRAVHDIFGHAAEKTGFEPGGEETAWNLHRQMFSPEARPALATETRGQAAYTYKYGDFPPQKAAILPGKYQVRPEDLTATAIQSQDAGAVNPHTGEPEATGQGLHGIEVLPEARERFANRPTGQDIQKFRQKNAAVFAKHPELRIGWDNDPTNHPDQPWELNIGAAGTPEGAAAVGKRLDQRAAFDIDKGESVPLGGKNQQTKFPDYPIEERLENLKNSKLSTPETESRPIADLLKKKFGTTNEHLKAGFILNSGEMIPLRGEHDQMINQVLGGAADKYVSGRRVGFINNEGAIRIRYTPNTRKGNLLTFSVPDSGVNEDQISQMRQAVGAMGRHGNVAMEVAIPNSLNGGLYTEKDFARPSDIENMLRTIGVHPEQSAEPSDLSTSERQSPLKEPYNVEITNRDGSNRIEPIQAFSFEDAMNQAHKKFPEAYRVAAGSFGDRTPSTNYVVPTEKPLSMPKSGRVGRSDLDTMNHELGHAMIGQKEGMTVTGMLRHTNPQLGRNTVASVNWSSHDLIENGKIKPEKRASVIKSFMGGIAQDEIRGLPRHENHNFGIKYPDSDGGYSYRVLRTAGYSFEQALEIMNRAIDENKEYLTHPAVSGIIEENAPYREADLSRQYHYSPERLRNMHAEAQRRINAGQKSDNGAVGGKNAAGGAANVPGGEGGVPKVGGQAVPAEKEINTVEVKSNYGLKPKEADRLRGLFEKTDTPNFIFTDGSTTGQEHTHLGVAQIVFNAPDRIDFARQTEFAKKTGAIRVLYPEFSGEENVNFETHIRPNQLQIQKAAEAAKNYSPSKRIVWDIYHNDKIVSGEGTIGDYQRALAEVYGPSEINTAEIRVEPTGSSVRLLNNPLKIKGTGEGGAPTTADVAQALSSFTTKKLAPLKLGEARPAAMVKRGAALAEDEAKYQLAQNNSGEDWYKSDMAVHDKELQAIRPELQDPIKMSLFKWSEAILSSGHKPSINVKKGLQNWDAYKETGKFSPLNVNFDPSQPISDNNRAAWGPRNAKSYGLAMEGLNKLIAEKGEKGAVDWLMAEHPLIELRQWMTASQTPVRGKADDTQPGYMILGAKRGPFGANLHGIETKFTADQWVSRTWNRWMGTIEADPETGEMRTDSPQNSTERGLMQQSFQAAASKLDKSLSSMQAILWYYEQALYTAHGVPKESWNFADAAKKVASDDQQSTKFNPEEYESKSTEKTPQSTWDVIKTLPTQLPKSKGK